MICNILIDRVLERGAPKKAEALVGAQLALQRSDRRIIHEKNIEKLKNTLNSAHRKIVPERGWSARWSGAPEIEPERAWT